MAENDRYKCLSFEAAAACPLSRAQMKARSGADAQPRCGSGL